MLNKIYAAGFGDGTFILGYETGRPFDGIKARNLEHYANMEGFGKYELTDLLSGKRGHTDQERRSIAEWYNKNYNNKVTGN